MFGNKQQSGRLCHETGFKNQCIKEQCSKWIRIQGKNPQDGTTLDTVDCSDTIIPLLLIDLGRRISILETITQNLSNMVAKNTALSSESLGLIASAMNAKRKQIEGA